MAGSRNYNLQIKYFLLILRFKAYYFGVASDATYRPPRSAYNPINLCGEICSPFYLKLRHAEELADL